MRLKSSSMLTVPRDRAVSMPESSASAPPSDAEACNERTARSKAPSVTVASSEVSMNTSVTPAAPKRCSIRSAARWASGSLVTSILVVRAPARNCEDAYPAMEIAAIHSPMTSHGRRALAPARRCVAGISMPLLLVALTSEGGLFITSSLARVKLLCDNCPMTREYGQFCGLARALELVGGRWTLLIVRDLLVGPKRFTELQEGLPGIPTNILSSRLRELEEAGLVRRSLLARPSSAVAYELTPYGLELEEALVRLGLWGSRSLGEPKKGDFFPLGSFALALKSAFRAERAKDHDFLFQIRIDGERLNVCVDQGQVSFPKEPSTEPDAALEMAPEVMVELLPGHLTVDSAIASGQVRVDGSKREARRFFDIFRLPSRAHARE